MVPFQPIEAYNNGQMVSQPESIWEGNYTNAPVARNAKQMLTAKWLRGLYDLNEVFSICWVWLKNGLGEEKARAKCVTWWWMEEHCNAAAASLFHHLIYPSLTSSPFRLRHFHPNSLLAALWIKNEIKHNKQEYQAHMGDIKPTQIKKLHSSDHRSSVYLQPE